MLHNLNFVLHNINKFILKNKLSRVIKDENYEIKFYLHEKIYVKGYR